MEDDTQPSVIAYSEPSPESFLPTPKPPPTGFEKAPQAGTWFVPILFAVCMVAVSIGHWGSLKPGGLSAGPQHLGKFSEWWRFLIALFAHGDFDHLSHNLPPFVLFAWLLRGYFGPWAFPWLALIAGIAANIATVYSYSVSDDGPSALLGASGMVYAMVGMWLVLYMAFDTRRSLKDRSLRAIGFALALFFPKTFEPRVSYMAHLSGFAIGGVLALLSIPWFRRFSPMLQEIRSETGYNGQISGEK